MDVDFEGLKAGLDLIQSTLGVFKDARDLLPEGPKRDAVTEGLEKAERATQLAEAQIAQALGYTLCKCSFPPRIMLTVGEHAYGGQRWKCPTCDRLEPSDQWLAERRREDEMVRRGPGGAP